MFGRKIAGALVLALALLCSGAGAFSIDGYTFASGMSHAIGGVAVPQSYFTVNFTLSNATGDNTGNTIYTDGTTAADWRDVRFTDASDTILPHWIESTTATTALVWVNVTSIPTDGTAIRCYYDSDDAIQASGITATFPFGDDFEDGSLDTDSRWAYVNSPSVTEAGGYMNISYAGSTLHWIRSQSVYGVGYVLKTRSKYSSVPSGDSYYGWGINTPAWNLLVAHGANGQRFAQFWPNSWNKDGQNPTAGWNVDEFVRASASSVIWKRNGTAGFSSSTNVPTLDLSFFARTATAGTYQLHDYIFVRTYLATEPTHGAYVSLDPPTAAFSADVTSGDAPLTVTFTDASAGAPAAWAWDFDNDGDTDSTDQNPTHEYSDAGTYTVKLTATNENGADDEIKADYITANQPYAVPVAAFSANVTSGYTPLAVAFTDASTGPPTEWAWTFTGPNEFYGLDLNQNPVLTFTEPGSYSVSLLASNPAGNDWENKTGYITVLALPAGPVASFTADAIAGHAPLMVSFTDTSTGSPTAWAWDFDGDAVADSTDQNPTYEYAANGTYTVTLQVSNAGGTDLETRAGYVYVGELTARLLRASFSYTQPIGTAPFPVSFTDTSVSNGTYARVWDFGDGETSTEPAPVHEYATAGKYDVELVITSDYTQDKSTARKAVMAYPAAAVSPLPTTTFGAHMTEIMESNWNVSVIGPIIPRAYTDALTPLAGDAGVGNMIFWGIIWVGVFMILFLRQGTPWLAALVGLTVGPGILTFLPPDWAHVGYICLAVTIGCSFFVIALGRFRST